jgi:membrane protease subunit (stomatin/prohibitin family)
MEESIMGLFSKNANESAYVGGKKHWADVIKNSGDGNFLIWRQPEEDFNTNSTLIVMPGEEAIFIKGGVIEQIFDNGTYKLSSENYPFISRLRNAFTGGVSTFNCVVYFVRKAVSQELLWGTDSPISVRDKRWGVLTTAGAHGAYKLRVENAAVFLEKLVGNNIAYQRQEDIFRYFENELAGKIKSTVSQFLNSWPDELIGLEAHLTELSASILPPIDNAVSAYGLKCVSFAVSGLIIDKSKYERFDEANIEQYEKIRGAEGDKEVARLRCEGEAAAMDAFGNKYGIYQAGRILGDLANNPGAGGIAATGAGFGMGIAAGSAFSTLAEQMFAPITGSGTMEDQPYGMAPSGRFEQADETQNSAPETMEMSPREKLKELKDMLDDGLITQEEYDDTKKAVLESMRK